MDPFRLEEAARQVLDPGETLVWCGAPDPLRLALRSLPLAAFGVPFTAFAAFWMVTASRIAAPASGASGPWPIFPLFGLPFLVIGLALLFAPVWVWRGARGTIYGITERRVFIAGKRGKAVRSFAQDELVDLEHEERADGSGDLYFATRATRGTRGAEIRARIGFIGIRDVRHVEATLRDRIQADAA